MTIYAGDHSVEFKEAPLYGDHGQLAFRLGKGDQHIEIAPRRKA